MHSTRMGDSLALGDEFAMNNAADVEKHDEHGLR
jgi:hypothetical protein